MPLLSLPTTNTGGVALSALIPWPWPPTKPVKIDNNLKDGRIIVEIGYGSTIRITIFNLDGLIIHQAITCPILAIERVQLVLIAEWTPDKMQIFIDNRDVIYPQDFAIYLLNEKGQCSTFYDFSQKNNKALRKRFTRYKYLTPIRPSSVRGGPGHLLDSLIEEAEQIEDLISLMARGKTSHVRGMCARLRLLLYRSGQSPLLQHTASLNNLPLIVYTSTNPTVKFPDAPIAAALNLNDISGFPRDHLVNPIDIDVWLGLRAIQIGRQEFSHENVIADLGNTIGSHLDINIQESIITLRSTSTDGFSTDGDGITRYVTNVANATLVLAKQVIESFDP